MYVLRIRKDICIRDEVHGTELKSEQYFLDSDYDKAEQLKLEVTDYLKRNYNHLHCYLEHYEGGLWCE